jgi:protein involved in polysaccharide export with SLBB domain
MSRFSSWLVALLLAAFAAAPALAQTEDQKIADRALKHLYPGGLLSATPICGSECSLKPIAAADAIPARSLPARFLAPSQDDWKPIPLSALGQPKLDEYRLGPGDLLGIHIDNVLEEPDTPPIVHRSDNPDAPPAIGYPILVRRDGTILLPRLQKSLYVAGKTLTEMEELIRKVYTEAKEIGDLSTTRIFVSLKSQRRYTVQVVRQEVEDLFRYPTRRQSVSVSVTLPAIKNDVVNALSSSGGVPRLDCINEIRIQRRLKDGSTQTIRIPVKVRKGDPLPFEPKDVILESGDVVFVEGRGTEVYQMSGPVAAQYSLPRDYDLRVIEALTRAYSGLELPPNYETPTPKDITIIRQTKDDGKIEIHVDLARAFNDPRENIIIQSGDMIIVPEPTPSKTTASKEAAASSNTAASVCGSVIFGGGVNCDAGLIGLLRPVSRAVPATVNNRVTIKTAAWVVECDRVVMMNEREMTVEGNVSLTMRQRDMTVQGSRVRVNLTDGSIQVDGK